ncbi:MAG: peptidase MA family metallohydrolase [Dehalococcoidia bacterium]|nr:peptidase MA family metallohydrolase [Dehalococcoidia bacterium]
MRSRIAPISAFAFALLAAATSLALAATTATTAHAGGIETDEPREESAEPTSLTFMLRVRAEAGLQSARLVYKVLNPDGDVGGSAEGAFTSGAETDVVFTLKTIDFQRYIPVGSTFVYHWELVDRDGDEFSTPEREFTFMDGRYTWRSMAEGGVRAFWYGNNDNGAMTALRAAREALETVGALLDTTVPYEVKVVVWRSEEDGEAARQSRGVVFDQFINTQGQRVAPDLIFVFAAASDVIRHETAHVVTHVAGDGPFSSIPSWLDEGTAVYAQSSPGQGYLQGLQDAVATDTTFSLRSMGAPANRPKDVNQFYGQAYSAVDFLIEEFGVEKFAELYRVHHEGQRIDGALQAVYGFDQNGLYNAWREANNLRPELLTAPPTATTAPAAEATRGPIALPSPDTAATTRPVAPADSATATPQPAAGAAEAAASDSSTAAGLIVGLIAVLLALGLGAGAFVMLRRN